MYATKPLTCGVCYCNPTCPILTNTAEKYIDLDQREDSIQVIIYMSLKKWFSTGGGICLLPLLSKGHLAMSTDIFSCHN